MLLGLSRPPPPSENSDDASTGERHPRRIFGFPTAGSLFRFPGRVVRRATNAMNLNSLGDKYSVIKTVRHRLRP